MPDDDATPPTPPAADPADAIVKRLRDAAPTVKKKAYASLYGYDMDDVIVSAVEANTIRGINPKKFGLKDSPLEIYRDWAADFLMWAGFGDFAEIADREAFEAFHARCRVSAERAFQKRGANVPLPFGQSAKLADLLLKRTVRFHEIPDARRIELSQFLHVPLEKHLLAALRDLGVKDRDGNPIAIPKSPTAAFVGTEAVYLGIQDVLSGLAAKAEVPPIFFDYIAWEPEE